MHCATVSYKLKYGVAELFCDKLIQNLRGTPFSLNLNEATSSNQLHVLMTLGTYYNKEQKSMSVEHSVSVNVLSVDPANLFEEMKVTFRDYFSTSTQTLNTLLTHLKV